MTRSLPVVVLLVLVAAGCGDGARDDSAPPRPPGSSSGSVAPVSRLDGTWHARITRRAFLGYATDRGVRAADARAMARRDLPGPRFRLDLLGGRFNVTGPTGESWHSGSFELRGDELLLSEPGFEEAGIPPFRLRVRETGGTVRFRVAPGQAGGPEHLPGVPGIVAGGALWCSVPWSRAGS